jgi:hypothetical protein
LMVNDVILEAANWDCYRLEMPIRTPEQ